MRLGDLFVLHLAKNTLLVFAGVVIAMGLAVNAAPPPVQVVPVYEQQLKQDPQFEGLWRFARYDQPLASSLRVYASGRRIVQGVDYTFGKDGEGWVYQTERPW